MYVSDKFITFIIFIHIQVIIIIAVIITYQLIFIHYTHASRGGNHRHYYQGRRSFPHQHHHSNNSDRDERESGYRSNGSDSSGSPRATTQNTEVFHNGQGPGNQEPVASTSQDRRENGDTNLNANRQ